MIEGNQEGAMTLYINRDILECKLLTAMEGV